MIKVAPVVICGGSGTRLWPLSRAGFPKQFLALNGNDTLFQQSVNRLKGLELEEEIEVGPLVIACNEDHRFLAIEQLREISNVNYSLILEPCGKNTAPALTLASLLCAEKDDDPVMVVMPADQAVKDEKSFRASLHQAIKEAESGHIVVLGIQPTHPETGYGYIKAEKGSNSVFDVNVFVEKPSEEKAKKYLEAGNYYWNSGIFVLRASLWLKAITEFREDIFNSSVSAWEKHVQDASFFRPDRKLFDLIPSESIDYAVMEKCPGSIFPVKMIPLNSGWSDLGAWSAVWDSMDKDDVGNVHVGDVLSHESHDCLIYSSSRLVALVGVSDLVVVETPDAVLVAKKADSQNIKSIVNTLQKQQRAELLSHRKVHRPWGWYDNLDEDGRFKVKRILVNPQASLSLQMHHHRAEHWVVVSGTAEIRNGDEIVVLSENQSTYIPVGGLHRLSNPGKIPLEIIEVQSGSYLGEDDIVRYEDNYGRKG